MKVLILTEAGKDTGFGHLTRCIAIYQALIEKKILPEFFINGDDSIPDLLKNINFKRINWLKKESRLLKITGDYQIVIIDSYLAKKSLYDRISENIDGRLVIIDDYNRLTYPKGIVINPSIYGDKLNYKNRGKSSYLLGKDFIILRKEFWNVKKKIINKELKNILITFGGMNHSGLISRIISYFKDRYGFRFKVVDSISKASAIKMAELMLEADICISGGGQTTYELARCGLPTFGICFANNQLLNLKAWQKTGFLEFIGRHKDKKLLLKIERLLSSLNYKKLRNMSRIGRELVDGQGARRIVKRIIGLAQ